jgi:hypothetical protein
MQGKHHRPIFERKVIKVVKKQNNVLIFFVTLHRFKREYAYIGLIFKQLKKKEG